MSKCTRNGDGSLIAQLARDRWRIGEAERTSALGTHHDLAAGSVRAPRPFLTSRVRCRVSSATDSIFRRLGHGTQRGRREEITVASAGIKKLQAAAKAQAQANAASAKAAAQPQPAPPNVPPST